MAVSVLSCSCRALTQIGKGRDLPAICMWADLYVASSQFMGFTHLQFLVEGWLNFFYARKLQISEQNWC